ncbi:hypothetical protein OE766_23445 [Pararhizobium sp. YC-54]|uniref:hypothetical protein n=1 Tax=Pararhizobium sp. YC-54 TaxID=2986920 RepID=UPI0021F709E4|nr:hypothetical protein [Pararhizobium sp. YC-54]MCW0001179.1 hypothetical protein [Pararhizobium sp. YC-54]
MNRLFQQKFIKLLNPRDGDPPRAAPPQATSVIIAFMLVLLVVGGLAHAFTELFHG